MRENIYVFPTLVGPPTVAELESLLKELPCFSSLGSLLDLFLQPSFSQVRSPKLNLYKMLTLGFGLLMM